MKQKKKRGVLDSHAFNNLQENIMTEEQFERFMRSQNHIAMEISKAIREVKDEIVEIAQEHFKNNT